MKLPVKKPTLETKRDVINYITRGMAPPREEFEQFMKGIDDGSINIKGCGKESVGDDLRLIYENTKNANCTLIRTTIYTAILAFLTGHKIGKRNGINTKKK